MAKLIYAALCSIDGYVADAEGRFDWAAPDEEVHQAVNDVMRPAGTHLYGRGMYDVLAAWETMDTGPDQPEVIRDFASLWRGAEKIVYSTTLSAPRSARTRIERAFDPEQVLAMKRSAHRDLTIGGPTLAALALAHGLVDDCHLFLSPVAVGSGLPALAPTTPLRFTLVDQRRFDNGVVHVHYRISGEGAQ